MLETFLRLNTILIVVILLSGCEQRRPEELSVAFSEEAHNQIFHIVREQEFDLNSGIKLKVYPTTSPAGTNRLFRNGIVNFAILDLDGAIRMADSEHITIIGALGRMQGTRGLLARPEIKSIADLRGRKVGAYRGSNRFLDGILESEGLSESDVELVYLPNIENERSLLEGEVDAVVALEPQVTRLKRAGLRELYNASETPLKPIYVLFTKSEYAEKHTDLIPALIESWESGLKYSYDNPRLTAGMLGPKIGLSSQEFENLINKFEPNMDLSTGFPYEVSVKPELTDPRFIESITPSTEGATPKIVLYWQK